VRRIVAPSLLLLFGSCTGLFAAEALVRFLFPPATLLVEAHPNLGWFHVPGKRGVYAAAPDVVRRSVSINSLGLLDDEHQYVKDDKTCRILILGDSMAEALAVSRDESFPGVIEEQLLETEGSCATTEVINAGVIGYSTDQEFVFYQTEGYKYDSDLVLLTFTVQNDVWNNAIDFDYRDWPPKPYFVLAPNGELTAIEPTKSGAVRPRTAISPPEPVELVAVAKRFLSAHSSLYIVVGNSLPHVTARLTRLLQDVGLMRQDWQCTGVHRDFEVFLPEYETAWEKAWAITEALILELNREVREQGGRFGVVILPSSAQVYPQLWRATVEKCPVMQTIAWDMEKPNRILANFLQENGIPYLDLLPPFKRATSETEDRGEVVLIGRSLEQVWTQTRRPDHCRVADQDKPITARSQITRRHG